MTYFEWVMYTGRLSRRAPHSLGERNSGCPTRCRPLRSRHIVSLRFTRCIAENTKSVVVCPSHGGGHILNAPAHPPPKQSARYTPETAPRLVRGPCYPRTIRTRTFRSPAARGCHQVEDPCSPKRSPRQTSRCRGDQLARASPAAHPPPQDALAVHKK